jgi:hypothetical protein
VTIGACENTKTMIKLHDDGGTKAFEVDTPDILAGNEFRGFWVKWQNSPKYNLVSTNDPSFPLAAFLILTKQLTRKKHQMSVT